MMAPARKFSCLSIPSSRILEQSNIAGTSGSLEDPVVTLYFGCAFAAPEADGPLERPNGLAPKSASERPVIPTNRPTKTRRLKNPPSPSRLRIKLRTGQGLRRAGGD